MDCLGDDAGDITVYLDGVRPGNVLRPDSGRVYYSIMWSLAQYPRWYASRMMGWLRLCYVQSPELNRIDGGTSQNIAALSQVLWDPNAGTHGNAQGLDLRWIWRRWAFGSPPGVPIAS